MNTKLVTATLLCTIGLAAQVHATDAPAIAGRKFLMAFRDCQARHDVATCSKLIADDAMLYSDKGESATKEAFLLDVAPHANPKSEEIVRHFSDPGDNVKGWRNGDLLFFNYCSVWTEMYGAQPYRIEYRATLVLRESDAGSKLLLFQATPIANTQRQPAQVDPSVFDQYVGEYSAGPGDHEVVTREGTHLLMTINGGRVELLPSASNSFYLRGEADEWVFIRDAQGKVTGLESRLWGQDILAKRLP